ncbi:MAG: type II toxin-antitoxin system VapC family toxin [Nitrosarchaeum sp.]
MVKKGSKAPRLLRSQSILDLTTYEIGNAVWKLAYLQKKITPEQACKLLESFVSLRQSMQILGINEIEEEIKNFSMTTGMTFYDSAYVIVAKRVGLALVTDDKSLAKTAAKYLTVIGSDDM